MVLALNRRKRRKGRRSRKSNPFGRRARRAVRRYSNRRRRSSNRRRHRNPAIALRGMTGRLTSGFKPAVLMDAGLIGAGVLGNAFIMGQVGKFVPQVRTGIMSHLAGLATSGLMLFVPKVGPKLFTGGVVGVIYNAAKQNIPQLARLGDFLDTSSGIGDFLEVGQLSQYEEDDDSLGEYYEEGQATGSGDLATQAASTFE